MADCSSNNYFLVRNALWIIDCWFNRCKPNYRSVEHCYSWNNDSRSNRTFLAQGLEPTHNGDCFLFCHLASNIRYYLNMCICRRASTDIRNAWSDHCFVSSNRMANLPAYLVFTTYINYSKRANYRKRISPTKRFWQLRFARRQTMRRWASIK